MEKIKKAFATRWHINLFTKLEQIIKRFRLAEKIAFFSIAGIFLLSAVVLIARVDRLNMTRVPAVGGMLTEGIVGSPRFINPVLAGSDVDQDLTELVYSGLFKAQPDGEIVPDLADSYTVATSGLVYTVTLKSNMYFSDGEPITADDVVFTINKIEDAVLSSPKRPAFYDVSVIAPDEQTIVFTLKQPYAGFLENLTVGILPKHIWNNVSDNEFPLSEYNIRPIGSGSYEITDMKTLTKDMFIVPTYYTLVPNPHAIAKPYIASLVLKFYQDEKSLESAYAGGDIDAMNSIDPSKVAAVEKTGRANIDTSTLPRIFAVFFNQNQSQVLADKSVRQALSLATDRDAIVNAVLLGYGKPITGPIPYGFGQNATSSGASYDPYAAVALLAKDGWTKSTSTGMMEKKIGKNIVPLEITLSTLASPDLVQAADMLQSMWGQIGVAVTVNQYELGDLEESVIRPRKFDALLYGIALGRDMDLFAFWHSSQRNDPGLNIAMYANTKADKLLEQARKTLDASARGVLYTQFSALVANDAPAVFLYSPDFIYVAPKDVQGITLGTVTLPFERFLDIADWYTDTNGVWNVFNNNK